MQDDHGSVGSGLTPLVPSPSASGLVAQPSGGDALDRLMDDMQVLYGMRAGHAVTQADLDALNRLDAHWRSEDERATDAYHRGWTDGLRKGGGEDAVTASERADAAWVEVSTERMMRKLADHRAATLLDAVRAADAFISAPQRMDTPAGGPKTATYRAENYNALTAKLRAVLFPASPEGVATTPTADGEASKPKARATEPESETPSNHTEESKP